MRTLKRALIGSIIGFLSLVSRGPLLAADVGVSVSVGQPGFYGRIDIGDFPRPDLVFAQPVIISPVVGVVRAPIYLNVPPGHAKDWGKHCHKYNACGDRVYFVQNHWYDTVYVPHYETRHGKSKGAPGNEHPGKGKGKDKH